jgi:hypothetical protein
MTTKKPKRTAKKFMRASKRVTIWLQKRTITLSLMIRKKPNISKTFGPNSKNGN